MEDIKGTIKKELETSRQIAELENKISETERIRCQIAEELSTYGRYNENMFFEYKKPVCPVYVEKKITLPPKIKLKPICDLGKATYQNVLEQDPQTEEMDAPFKLADFMDHSASKSEKSITPSIETEGDKTLPGFHERSQPKHAFRLFRSKTKYSTQ